MSGEDPLPNLQMAEIRDIERGRGREREREREGDRGGERVSSYVSSFKGIKPIYEGSTIMTYLPLKGPTS